MRFTGWDGRAYVAARIWDGTDGDRFVVTPVGAGADSADASVTDTLQLTVSGGTKVSAKLVADSRPVNAGSVPETVDVYEAATFSAPGEADASYKWWFPTKDLSSNSFGVQGIPPGYQSADGATVTHSFIQTGLVTAYLAKTTADGAYTVTSYPINVLETRWADRITVDGPTTVRLGESVTPTITTASGLPFTVSQAGISCGAVYSGGSFEALRADAPGTCTFVVKTLGNADYAPASLTGAFEIYRGEQTITVGDWASLPVGDTEAIPATASSGLPVTATVVPESSTVCSVSGATVSALASGTCSLVLTQAGNSSYLPAVPATTSFAVTRGQQSITIEPLDDLTYGESQPVVASSSASAPVTIAIDPASAAICSYDAETGAITAVGVGTCRVTADQDGDDDYLPAPQASSEFAVTPAPLSVTAEDTSMQYGGATPEFTYTVSPSIAVAGVVCETTDPLTAGDHPIVCSGGDAGPDYAIEYVSGTLTVTPAPATVTVTPAEVQYSDPVPDLDVSWSVDGLLGSDTLTGELSGCRADGLDIDQGRVTSSAGAYPLSGCDGLGNPNYRVSYEGAVNVERETSTLSYDGEWYVSTVDAAGSDTGSGTASLAATVAQADDGSDGDVTKATVDFLLFSSGNTSNTPTASMTGVAVDSLGHASAQAPGLAPDVYRVVVRVSPTNGYFTGPITTDQLAVYQPVRGASASGGGWMADPGSADGRGQFGLSVRYGKEREPQGSATFSWVDPDTGYQYLLASDSWQGGDLAIAGARVSLTATASLTVTDPRTRKVIDALSGGHRTIRVVATDGGKGGQNDDVAVTALSPSGQVLHAVSTTSIGGGNVTVSR
ncbi:MBG domain-containing protein [Agromyces sp. SYSU T0242]|uniref:MBG domain-containing protein n=1 Tax=Agromyces litoreus TaxID=3158561 RepID=UPI00339B7BE8